ncbi:TrpR, YerC/YecD [Candidatus Gracilibacteria bacterium]|nr:TrpR, YerC/YecD [Candidatus Gracilibacteria bacterium]MCF7819263.1 TrpR, YerC/YecD [Candidatus Gracilibacteria bacterium]
MNLNSPLSKDLFRAILSLQNEDEARRFLRDLLTEGEIEEFSRRWQVAQMLEKKMPYTQIEKKTGMSSRTIARVSQFLNGVFGGYKIVLKRFHHHNDKASPVRRG